MNNTEITTMNNTEITIQTKINKLEDLLEEIREQTRINTRKYNIYKNDINYLKSEGETFDNEILERDRASFDNEILEDERASVTDEIKELRLLILKDIS